MELNRLCVDCKSKVALFKKYCAGIEGDYWTIKLCHQARKQAGEAWFREHFGKFEGGEKYFESKSGTS